jgi:dsRNA-specific ribonuclease
VTDRGASYERLEFLGDAVLGAAVAEAVWRRFPAAPRGAGPDEGLRGLA